ncbi:type II secretion system protein N [Psychrobium sp. 1_MG-2023]|uniref:type II secretion system protein N n=1 Tax=Psychrobium sp. 1_MG-2023 TaxID=3062624 RepID=UPI000C31DAA4|nr:type II secretion system protein N [Psychrobium sp. 1_MG-2023]MDP2561941.1 type II secretion system protein N [Psychrobium sp. 1_MG-2023]PKF58676.1 hypothetical protein CW748_03310 [Alteromonadales bacterium alter-6D02]
MKKIVGYIIASAVVYFVFLISIMPATAVLPWVKLPPQIKLGAVSGSIWQGQVSSLSYQGLTVAPIHWKLAPLSLVSASAQLDIKLGSRQSEIQGAGQLTVKHNEILIDGLTLQAPIEQLTRVVALPMGLSASGRANLDVSAYHYTGLWCQELNGQLNVNELVVSSGFGQVDVTRAQAKLGCDQGNLVAKLVPNTNSLGIKLDATLDKSQRLTTTGFIKPPANAPKDFVNLLKFMGQPNPNGQYLINYTMAL